MAVVSNVKIEENKYEFLISIDAEAFEKAIDKVYHKVRGKIKVNGFRKGKVPRHMIEKLYGETAFYDDAVRDLAPDEILDAVKGEGLELVDTPEMEVISVSKDAGVELKVNVTVKPAIRLSGYKGIVVPRVVKPVTEEDVQQRLQFIRERNSRLITVEDRAAIDGDTVVIDFEGFADGEAFEGGKGENFSLVLGSGQFIPGFEEQIIGRETGDEFTVNVTFPEDYDAEELAGKPAEFKVSLLEIQEKETPDLDDEFAKDTTEFETLAEFADDLRKRMEKVCEEEADRNAEDALFTSLAGLVEAEIPDVMFEQKIDEMVRDFGADIIRQGFSMERYFAQTRSDMPALRESFREVAQLQVRVRLALDRIAAEEGLVVTDEEIDSEIAEIAERHGYTPEKVRAIVRIEAIREDLLAEKAAAFVKENAKYI
jgi:trigger factor